MSVSVQSTFCATLVDEWAQLGVTDAVVCPGSRSTPMTMALAVGLTVHVRLDERSAAFFALGLAKATGRPTVICTTSGTAAVELHPAVVEAHHGRVPLIVCTADRPPELQGIGASQTIDQIGLFTTATRWSSAPGVPEDYQRSTWRSLAAQAFAQSTRHPNGPGPVHLNLAFREPLVGDVGPLPDRPGQTQVEQPSRPTAAVYPPLGGRGLIIAGADACNDPAAVLALGAGAGWPVLADPASGCRLEGTVAAADAIVRTPVALPEVVLLLGTPWLSKALAEYTVRAQGAGARVIAMTSHTQRVDPNLIVTESYAGVDVAASLAAALAQVEPGDPQWLVSWDVMEQQAQSALTVALGDDLNEPQVARIVAKHAARSGAALMVSASMPMRDIEWFVPPMPTPPRVLTNRGANGIDGIVSTALGIATSGRPTMTLLGDLAFLHDVSGLVNLDPTRPCAFVVLDNGGGGIFSFLPQADALAPPSFEELFGTPPTSDVSAVATGFGLPVTEVTTTTALTAALTAFAEAPSPRLIRVHVPGRTENVAIHNALNEAVRLAIA